MHLCDTAICEWSVYAHATLKNLHNFQICMLLIGGIKNCLLFLSVPSEAGKER